MVGQWRVRPEAQVNGFYWKGLGLSSFAERDDRRRLRDSGHVNRERTLMCGVSLTLGFFELHLWLLAEATTNLYTPPCGGD